MPFGSSKAAILGAAGGAGGPIEATGGSITTSGDYTLHTFTSSGTFTVTAGSGDLWMVAVGAGGGSGHGRYDHTYGWYLAPGGGGGGGVHERKIEEQPRDMATNNVYTVTIGAGTANANGSNTIVSTP